MSNQPVLIPVFAVTHPGTVSRARTLVYQVPSIAVIEIGELSPTIVLCVEVRHDQVDHPVAIDINGERSALVGTVI